MDEYYHIFTYVVRWFWVQGPMYLVWLVGIIWALLTWTRHRRKSFLVMLILTTFLIEGLIRPFVDFFLLTKMGGLFPGDATMRWMIVEFCRSVVIAGLWLLLFVALFVPDRPPPRGPDGERLPADWDRPAGPAEPGRGVAHEAEPRGSPSPE